MKTLSVETGWREYQKNHRVHCQRPVGKDMGTVEDDRYKLAFWAGQTAAGDPEASEAKYQQWWQGVKGLTGFEKRTIDWLQRLEMAYRAGFVRATQDRAPGGGDVPGGGAPGEDDDDGREFSDEELGDLMAGVDANDAEDRIKDRIKDLLRRHGYEKKEDGGDKPEPEPELPERDRALLALPGKQEAFQLGWEQRGRLDATLNPSKHGQPDKYEELAAAVRAFLHLYETREGSLILRKGSDEDHLADKHPVLRDLLNSGE